MNYTEKYHLPQWEETDRIMRVDFNRMCADMEAGLAGNHTEAKQTADTLAAQIAEVRQESADRDSKNLAESKSDLQSGLFRLAYGQYTYLLEMDEPREPDGIFLQRMPVGTVPANCQGLQPHQEGVWCASSGPEVNTNVVKESFKEVSPLKMVTGNLNLCQKGVITFTCPGAACTRYVFLTGVYNEGSGEPGRLLVTLDNLTRGVRELEVESNGYLAGETTGRNIQLDITAGLHGGDKYQLEVIPLAATVTATFQFTNVQVIPYDQSTNSVSGTVSHSFGTAETGHGGLILARYDAHDKGGALTASWGGAEQQPLRVRSFTDSKGRKVKEAEFRFTSPIPGKSTAVLRATVPSGGDLVLYHWCAALL